MLDEKIRVHEDVVDTKLDDGEVVLLHLETKTYYSLNVTGERIWQGLKKGLTLREISRHLGEEFDVSPDETERCVIDLAKELCEQKLALVDETNC